jgi:hypothetical protein
MPWPSVSRATPRARGVGATGWAPVGGPGVWGSVFPEVDEAADISFVHTANAIAAATKLEPVASEDTEIAYLIDFLNAPSDSVHIDPCGDVPKRVPSGLTLAESVPMSRGKIEAWMLTSVYCVLTPLFYCSCTRLLLAHF